jgi:hypothetical protein
MRASDARLYRRMPAVGGKTGRVVLTVSLYGRDHGGHVTVEQTPTISVIGFVAYRYG